MKPSNVKRRYSRYSKETSSSADLKSEISEFSYSEGASLVGVASIDRFRGAPEGHGPLDFVKKAQSVIVVGMKVPDAIVEYDQYAYKFRGKPSWASQPVPITSWIKALDDNMYLLLGHYSIDMMLDKLAIRIALKLEDAGYRSLPTPVAGYSGVGKGVSHLLNYFSFFSQRHAAVRAGLAEFGLNNLVLTPQFGPRVRFVSIITEALLEPDPLISKKVCLREKCDVRGPRCLKVCPSRAIQRREHVDDNSVFIDTPSKTDARLCTLTDPSGTPSGRHACVFRGRCMAVCPVGGKRTR